MPNESGRLAGKVAIVTGGRVARSRCGHRQSGIHTLRARGSKRAAG